MWRVSRAVYRARNLLTSALSNSSTRFCSASRSSRSSAMVCTSALVAARLQIVDVSPELLRQCVDFLGRRIARRCSTCVALLHAPTPMRGCSHAVEAVFLYQNEGVSLRPLASGQSQSGMQFCVPWITKSLPKWNLSNRSWNGVLVIFSDGQSAIYPSDLLLRLLPQASPVADSHADGND